jgi:molecular chaperone GrpE
MSDDMTDTPGSPPPSGQHFANHSDSSHAEGNNSGNSNSGNSYSGNTDDGNTGGGNTEGESNGLEPGVSAEDFDLEAMVALEPVGGAEHAEVVAQRDEYLDALRRLQADFENYRKRVQRDSDAAADRAGEKLVNRLLPVLDTFEFALAHEADPDASPMAKMHDSLLSALEGEGLERVSPLGEPFDPNSAEAVMHDEGDGGEPIVSEVLRAGYIWKSRVIRAAMVKVRG